jgi:hypothetical protein
MLCQTNAVLQEVHLVTQTNPFAVASKHPGIFTTQTMLTYLRCMPVLMDREVRRQVNTLMRLFKWQDMPMQLEDVARMLYCIQNEYGAIFQAIRLVGSSWMQEPAAWVSSVRQILMINNAELRS